MIKSNWAARAGTIVLILMLVLAAAACQDGGNAANNQGNDQTPPQAENNTPGNDSDNANIPEPEPYTTEADLVAVGDIMMHSTQIPAAYDPETDTYSFETYFRHVKPLLQGDWVIGNLETPMAGEDMGGYSGYPMFNAPEALADAMVEAGFHIVSTANNHALDRSWKGALKTLEHVKASGLKPVGTYDSAEAAEQILIVEQKQIRMAFLSYTYGTNGIPVPEDMPYLVNLIDEAKIKNDIAKAKEQGADLVTVSMHFGHEYHLQPSEEQKRLARSLVEAGADIILGSHPHIIQPYEWIETTGEDGVPRKGVVVYSMANFISNQGPDMGTDLYTDVGMIFRVSVKKHFPEGTVEIDKANTVITWVNKYFENGKRQYRILPIEDTLALGNDPILTEQQYDMLESYLTFMQKHVESMAVPVNE